MLLVLGIDGIFVLVLHLVQGRIHLLNLGVVRAPLVGHLLLRVLELVRQRLFALCVRACVCVRVCVCLLAVRVTSRSLSIFLSLHTHIYLHR